MSRFMTVAALRSIDKQHFLPTTVRVGERKDLDSNRDASTDVACELLGYTPAQLLDNNITIESFELRPVRAKKAAA